MTEALYCLNNVVPLLHAGRGCGAGMLRTRYNDKNTGDGLCKGADKTHRFPVDFV